MQPPPPIDPNAPTRDLIRVLRAHTPTDDEATLLPESVLWQAWCELRRRGESAADAHFIRGVKQLHRRRALGATALPTQDSHPVEHKLVDDPMIAELWKAYKRCICSHRTAPASQLLRDIATQMDVH